MENHMAYEWIEDARHESQDFRDFIDFCFIHFRPQMHTLIEAYVAGGGKAAFDEWVASFDSPDNQAACRADEQRDAERDV